MGTIAGLPTLNPKIDNETKKLVNILAEINNHGLSKIVYITKGEYYTPKFNKDGTPDLLKSGDQKMTRGGFTKKKRPLEIVQPDGTTKSVKELKALTLVVINVGHDYVKMIKNQMSKLGLDPNDFNAEGCKYSQRFSPNGLVRQHINPSKDKTFYFRYFTGVNGITYKTYEVIYLNENGEIVEIPQDYKSEYFNSTAPSVKQAALGLEKEIKPRNLGLDNLIYFQKGEAIFNERMTPEVMKLLNLEWV